MNNPHTPRYKRGTVTKDGKLYGRYPDGSLYRIYSTSDRPFLQIVNRKGETFVVDASSRWLENDIYKSSARPLLGKAENGVVLFRIHGKGSGCIVRRV